MVSALEAVTGYYRGAVCSVLSNADDAARFMGRVAVGPNAIGNAIAALRRTVCSGDPDDDPVFEPPFTGGQCPVNYILRVNRSFNPVPAVANPPVRMGPITGFTAVETGPGPSGSTFVLVTFTTASGSSTLTLTTPNGASDVSFGAVRQDGNPDNCGDPPPVLPPPSNINYGDNITYNVDESTEITVPIVGIFAPVYVALDGSINAPITFDLGGVDFTGNLKLAPKFDVEIFPTNITGGGGGVDNPDTLPPVDPADDEPVDPAPLEETIIGVIVRVTTVPPNGPTSIATDNIPTIYAPRLGSVSFAIASGSAVAWTSDIDIKNVNTYIPCPAPQGAVDFGATPVPGVTLTARAVRGVPLTA